LTRVSPFKSCVEGEEETAKVTFEKFKKEFKLYERCFDLCMETIDYLLESTENKLFDSEAKTAIMVILPSIVQSMQSIRLLRTKGYYYDSAIVERSLIESIGLCAYLSLDEEEATRWLDGKSTKVARINLFDYVSRLLRGRKDFAEMKQVYGQLSDYVHRNLRAAVQSVTFPEQEVNKVRDSGSINLQFIPQFDEKNVGRISVYPLVVTKVLERIFKKELELDKKRQKKSEKLLRLHFRTRLARAAKFRKGDFSSTE
jgi:hypothetical protein